MRGFVLDADGVLVLQAKPLPGSVEAVRALEARGIPFRVVTNFSQLHRDTLAGWFEKGGLRIAPDRIITGHVGDRGLHGGDPRRPALFVLAATDARREFDGQQLLSGRRGRRAPGGLGGGGRHR